MTNSVAIYDFQRSNLGLATVCESYTMHLLVFNIQALACWTTCDMLKGCYEQHDWTDN